MNCPDNDFSFQQQKIVFRRLLFFFLSVSLFFFLYFSSSNFFSHMCTLLNKYESEQTYATILDEAAHQQRDDAFSFLHWSQNETASKNVKENKEVTNAVSHSTPA